MSLAIEITRCQERLQEAGRKASAECRRLREIVPAEMYDELMLQLCVFASETNQLKVLLGSLRMIGELEQRPPPVTAESLELAGCVPVVPAFPAHPLRDEREAFRRELQHIGDDTYEEGES